MFWLGHWIFLWFLKESVSGLQPPLWEYDDSEGFRTFCVILHLLEARNFSYPFDFKLFELFPFLVSLKSVCFLI